jgi:hypothetical protein
LIGAFQGETCAAFINDRFLADASPTDPIVIDPETQSFIDVIVDADGGEGAVGRVWIEFGGFATFTRSGDASGGFTGGFDLQDNGFADLGGAPGLYHVGGSIDGSCSVDGYVRISGNPLTGPVAPAGAGAVLLGFLFTWIAGRPPASPRTSSASPPSRTRRLDATGREIGVGDAELRSPGLDGEVEVHEPTEVAITQVAQWTDATREALARHHVDVERIVEIAETVESEGAAATRPLLDHVERPSFQLELPNPGPDHAQVVLATDESGVVGWHFPRSASGAIDQVGAGDTLRYRIARQVGRAKSPERRRGIATAVGAKVLSSLVFPLLDPVFERVGEGFARTWETKRRPYRLRTFTPDDFREDTAVGPDWEQLARGKSLLFVHGTFSRAHTGFAELPVEMLADLHELYDGGVFAFDHFTLSDDPRRNVAWFFDHVPGGIRLNLDIVCHSRGGLVSRIIAERQDDLAVADRGVDVDKIVFVGTPNAGTVLTEPTYIGDFIDTYTNLLNFVPGHLVADVFEGVITAVKHVAVGALSGLDGLQAMRPGGEFLRWLNRSATNPSRYFAVAGDYEPQVGGWRNFAKDRLMDGVFNEPNDLVVPTEGTFGENGSSHFPIAIRHQFGGEDGVDHTGYFANRQVGARLLEWLRA